MALPSLARYYPISFCEDSAGGIWIGFNAGGGLLRIRDGRFTRFTSDSGLPDGGIFNLFVDSSGRLWVPTTRGGVARIDNPTSEQPTVTTMTTEQGLSSNDVKAVTEDRWGRIYFGTGRGIDRFDPTTGRFKYYTTADGVLLGNVLAAMQDRNGAVWFSFPTGLIRLVPEPEHEPISSRTDHRFADSGDEHQFRRWEKLKSRRLSWALIRASCKLTLLDWAPVRRRTQVPV